MRQLQKLLTRLNHLHMAVVCLLLYLFAPGSKAEAVQFDEASGSNPVNQIKQFGIAGVQYDFGRNRDTGGSMSRRQDDAGQFVSVFMNEQSSVTFFSSTTVLHGFNIGATRSMPIGGGEESKNWFFSLNTFDNSVGETGTGPAKKKNTIVGKGKVDLAPQPLEVEIDLKVFTPKITAQVELDVNVTETMKVQWEVDFPEGGIDMKRVIKSDTKADFAPEVRVVGISIAGVSVQVKLAPKVTFTFADSEYEVAAEPRFDALKGKARSLVKDAEFKFGGAITLEASFLKAKASTDLVTFPEGKLTFDASPMVLYDR